MQSIKKSLKERSQGKLKKVYQRKPTEYLNMEDLSRQVSKETGFAATDIREVLYATLRIMVKALTQKKYIKLPVIGMIYPTIRRSRSVNALNGGIGKPIPMKSADAWVLRLQPGAQITRMLKELKVTEEELKSLTIES